MTPMRRLVVVLAAAILVPACKSAPPPATGGTTPAASASKEATGAPAAPATPTAALPETVAAEGADTIFDAGEFKSTTASRHNDDGTYSLFPVDPGVVGIEFVVGEKDGKRTLTTRDAQHEYVFVEQ